jgi:hypothetical protein
MAIGNLDDAEHRPVPGARLRADSLSIVIAQTKVNMATSTRLADEQSWQYTLMAVFGSTYADQG